MASGIDWTEDAIARLRVFWRDGFSTAEIGRRMGTSKNSVVGKAHRLGLPPRPSPIRGKGNTPRLPAPARTRGPIQPPPHPARPPATVQGPPRRADPPPPPPVLAEPEGPAPGRPALRQPCCWPIGHPGRPGFRFCEADALLRKPYCAEHAGTAYVEPEATRDRLGSRGFDLSRRRGLTRTP